MLVELGAHLAQYFVLMALQLMLCGIYPSKAHASVSGQLNANSQYTKGYSAESLLA